MVPIFYSLIAALSCIAGTRSPVPPQLHSLGQRKLGPIYFGRLLDCGTCGLVVTLYSPLM